MWLGSAGFVSAAEPPITAATFAPDGQSILVGSQRGLREYSWPALQLLRTLDTSLMHIHDLAFSDAGKQLAAVGGRPAETGELEVVAWPDGASLSRKIVGEDVLYQVVWRTAGAGYYIAGPDHRVLALNLAGELDYELSGHSGDVSAVALLTAETLVSAGEDQTLRVWQTNERQMLRTLSNHTQPVLDLAVRPSGGEVLASCGADRTIRFWQPRRGRLMRFAKLPSPALAIAWTPDGSRLVAACADGHLRCIDPDSVTITQDEPVADGWLYTLAVAPDSRFAFVGGEHGTVHAIPLSTTTADK